MGFRVVLVVLAMVAAGSAAVNAAAATTNAQGRIIGGRAVAELSWEWCWVASSAQRNEHTTKVPFQTYNTYTCGRVPQVAKGLISSFTTRARAGVLAAGLFRLATKGGRPSTCASPQGEPLRS